MKRASLVILSIILVTSCAPKLLLQRRDEKVKHTTRSKPTPVSERLTADDTVEIIPAREGDQLVLTFIRRPQMQVEQMQIIDVTETYKKIPAWGGKGELYWEIGWGGAFVIGQTAAIASGNQTIGGFTLGTLLLGAVLSPAIVQQVRGRGTEIKTFTIKKTSNQLLRKKPGKTPITGTNVIVGFGPDAHTRIKFVAKQAKVFSSDVQKLLKPSHTDMKAGCIIVGRTDGRGRIMISMRLGWHCLLHEGTAMLQNGGIHPVKLEGWGPVRKVRSMHARQKSLLAGLSASAACDENSLQTSEFCDITSAAASKCLETVKDNASADDAVIYLSSFRLKPCIAQPLHAADKTVLRLFTKSLSSPAKTFEEQSTRLKLADQLHDEHQLKAWRGILWKELSDSFSECIKRKGDLLSSSGEWLDRFIDKPERMLMLKPDLESSSAAHRMCAFRFMDRHLSSKDYLKDAIDDESLLSIGMDRLSQFARSHVNDKAYLFAFVVKWLRFVQVVTHYELHALTDWKNLNDPKVIADAMRKNRMVSATGRQWVSKEASSLKSLRSKLPQKQQKWLDQFLKGEFPGN